MLVKVLAFSRYAELVGAPVVPVELPDGSTVDHLVAQVRLKYPVLMGAPVAVAVNQEVASGSTVIRSEDEVALLPPVSGG